MAAVMCGISPSRASAARAERRAAWAEAREGGGLAGLGVGAVMIGPTYGALAPTVERKAGTEARDTAVRVTSGSKLRSLSGHKLARDDRHTGAAPARLPWIRPWNHGSVYPMGQLRHEHVSAALLPSSLTPRPRAAVRPTEFGLVRAPGRDRRRSVARPEMY
jgi:hypothetical protein